MLGAFLKPSQRRRGVRHEDGIVRMPRSSNICCSSPHGEGLSVAYSVEGTRFAPRGGGWHTGCPLPSWHIPDPRWQATGFRQPPARPALGFPAPDLTSAPSKPRTSGPVIQPLGPKRSFACRASWGAPYVSLVSASEAEVFEGLRASNPLRPQRGAGGLATFKFPPLGITASLNGIRILKLCLPPRRPLGLRTDL